MGPAHRCRLDHTVGLVAVILLSISVMVIASIAVPTGEPTVVDPAYPLVEMIGPWALYAFLAGAGAASFSNATGTLFAAGFMVPQSFGHDTVFGDAYFRRTVNLLIALSVVIAVLVLSTTDLTPVHLAIIMPAINGVIGLPLTVLALYGTVARYFDLSRAEHVVFAATVVLAAGLALVTAESRAEQIIVWL